MKVIKIRSIDEAKELVGLLPPIPLSTMDAFDELRQRAAASKSGRHSVLRGIYNIVDQVGALLDPFTVCTRGCSACCRIAVEVTELEAAYIERNSGKSMRRGVVSRPPSLDVSDACPLLGTDGLCTVYSWRPLACRAFATFDDPKFCAQSDVKHVTYGRESNTIFQSATQWLHDLNGSGAVADIRAFFPRA